MNFNCSYFEDETRVLYPRNGKKILGYTYGAFMPVKGIDWSGMERLYNEYVMNYEIDVYVMPVPYG